MKRYKNNLLLVFFLIMSIQAVSQVTNYAFDVQKSGNGARTIILLPGFASSGEVWDETIKHLEQDFTCFTLTMPGFAGVAPQPNASFEQWKNSIAAFIKENNFEQPTLLGHSMGGALALAIAADYPTLIGNVIVVDALACLQALSNPSFDASAVVDCSANVAQLKALSEQDFYQMQKKAIPMLVQDSTKQQKILNWSMQSDRATFAEIYCDFWNTDLREVLNKIQCPTMVLLNSYFSTIDSIVEQQYSSLKNVEIHYAQKGLHFIMYDDKEWYLSKVTDFLNTP